jgi:hypothetical protein
MCVLGRGRKGLLATVRVEEDAAEQDIPIPPKHALRCLPSVLRGVYTAA